MLNRRFIIDFQLILGYLNSSLDFLNLSIFKTPFHSFSIVGITVFPVPGDLHPTHLFWSIPHP